MTKKYLLTALLFLLIGSAGWALYFTQGPGPGWGIVGFGIGLVFSGGGISLLIVWLLLLLRSKK